MVHILVLGALCWVLGAACSGDSERDEGGSSGDGDGDGDSDADGGLDEFDNPTPTDGLDGGFDGSAEDLELSLSPEGPTLRIVHGEDLPTLQFEVKNRGAVVPAIFRVDSGELGRIDDDGLFTPSGTRGGETLIEARVGARVLQTLLTIEVEWVQNGAEPDPDAMTSAGGYGGVGGEGPGGAVDEDLEATLSGDPTKDADLKWLYPYDQTVFPLEMLAPLLMWQVGEDTAVADGIALRLSGTNFEYTGFFGRPDPLAADVDFVRHPIPQDVWEAATRTVAGSALKVELSVAKGNKLYGPIKQTWKIARGSLKGTVYYQSYGTHLAKNHGGAIGGDGMFGGATLAIKPGAIEPELVAGGDGGADQCRVCHSVSSDGSRMMVQHGDDYETTSSYDLLNANMQSGYPPELTSQLAWIGMTPDGALGLSNGEPLGVDGDPKTKLYDLETGAEVPTMGLELIEEAAFPAFSHDGRKVAFNFFRGMGDATIGMGDGKKLVAMDFDPMMNVFDNAELLYEGELPAGWPSFSPTGNGVFYQVQVQKGTGPDFETRYGAKGELWWTNLQTGDAHKLDNVNGIDEAGDPYLPTSADNHMEDQVLNYEPTMAPVASGGYAWIVFTSRRMYGNVATIDPWFSDPREHDLTETPTTKKLWVAAIELDVDTEELSVDVGPDPSHPAFYLPGQELLAGNARGFWVVDPCKADGKTCESGVECCSGYCQEDDEGDLTCGKKTGDCSEEFDRCDTSADCCDPESACVNNVCSILVVE